MLSSWSDTSPAAVPGMPSRSLTAAAELKLDVLLVLSFQISRAQAFRASTADIVVLRGPWFVVNDTPHPSTP